MRPAPVSAFTLMELLVAMLIFSVVGLGMVATLATATDIFRLGEAGRASQDEAVAALATIQDDLERMVQKDEGGFVYAQIGEKPRTNAAADPGRDTGNCILAFKTVARDRSVITTTGGNARLIVIYWVDPVSAELRRAEITAADSSQNPNATDDERQMGIAYASGTGGSVVGRGCLHFSAWISADLSRRENPGNWAKTSGGTVIRPTHDNPYSTQPPVPNDLTSRGDPFPDALRILVVLSADHRFAAKATLRQDLLDTSADDRIAITGAKTLPGGENALVRIDDEWIRYRLEGGRMVIGANDRAQFRSVAKSHTRGTELRTGALYTLIKRLGR